MFLGGGRNGNMLVREDQRCDAVQIWVQLQTLTPFLLLRGPPCTWSSSTFVALPVT